MRHLLSQHNKFCHINLASFSLVGAAFFLNKIFSLSIYFEREFNRPPEVDARVQHFMNNYLKISPYEGTANGLFQRNNKKNITEMKTIATTRTSRILMPFLLDKNTEKNLKR